MKPETVIYTKEWEITEQEERSLAYDLKIKALYPLELFPWGCASDRAGILIGTEKENIFLMNRNGRDETITIFVDKKHKLDLSPVKDRTPLPAGKISIYDNDCHDGPEYTMITIDGPAWLYRVWNLVFIQPEAKR